MPLLKLLMSTENKHKRKYGHIVKLRSLSKLQKKMDNFFLKELKKNETTEQYQNISLNPKDIISPKLISFKGLPTNTMNNTSSVSRLKLKQTESLTIKSMTQSLASRSYQGGISKSNTAPQLAGTVVHDKNTKEHPKNKVNQKELPQLITNILATSLKLKQNFKQKYLMNKKKTQ